MNGKKIVRIMNAAALFFASETIICASNQSVERPTLARSNSPWNLLAYGGKGEMHGAPICHPLNYFSVSPLSLDFDADFFGEKPDDLATQTKVTILGTMSGREVYKVMQMVHRKNGSRPDDPVTNSQPTMKILLVQRRSGEFCDIYENQYAYDPRDETDEAVILNINGREVLKTYETDKHTWFLVYWAMDEHGPVRLTTDALYAAVQSTSPAGALPYSGPFNLTGSHFTAEVSKIGSEYDGSPLGRVDLKLAVEGDKIIVVGKTWIPFSDKPR